MSVRQVRIWPSGSHIKVATDYDAKKNTELYIDDLNPDEQYKLRVFGYSRGGDGTMSSPAIYFQTGETDGETDWEIDGEIDWEIDGETDWEIDGETDR